MKQALMIVAAMLGISNADAGVVKKLVTKTLTKTMTLKIDREGGANGAAVVWHPGQQKYYAAMAGNSAFPLIIFDAKGTKVSGEDLETQFDMRGFWYNPMRKSLQMNGYHDFGWGEYKLDSKGIPESVKQMPESTGQPDDQSAGAYDAENDVVYFFDHAHTTVERHLVLNSNVDAKITLYPGATNKSEYDEISKSQHPAEYNENALVFTGTSGAEIGLLNYTARRIELYSIATGYMTQVLNLPDDASLELSLNFSYCNNIFWLFNKDTRTWQGYKA